MKLTLRDYQYNAADAILLAWQTHTATLLVIPTGTGKTIVFAAVIHATQPGRTMVLAHREELIWQAQQKIESSTGLRCEVEMGELKAGGGFDGEAPVIVSTIQTQTSEWLDGSKRMTKFNPMDFSLLVIDEAHHSASKSYIEVINWYRRNPNLKVLGVTATPDRADEKALGKIFESVAFDYEIIDAIRDGWLVPIEQQMVHIEGLDFSQIRTTAGDLNGADLAAVMEAEKNLQGVAGAAVEIIGKRRAIVFTASVKQAEIICEIFNRHRPSCAKWVCGKTNKDERRETVAQFARGEVQIVCNCGCFTEGFDDPGVEVIIMARPTKSRSLYSQMVGRSTRALPGVVDGPQTPELRRAAIAASAKPACLVVDFCGNSGRHKLMTSADILGGKDEEVIERAVARAKTEQKSFRMTELLEEEAAKLREEKEKRRLLEEARKARIKAKVTFSTTSVDPFDRYQVRRQPPNAWERRNGHALTERQRFTLQKMGVNPDEISVSCGRKLLGARFNGPCSEAQANVLRKHGYSTEVSMKEASKLIDALAKNGWKRPVERSEDDGERVITPEDAKRMFEQMREATAA